MPVAKKRKLIKFSLWPRQAALHTAYHVTLDAALPRRLGANFYSNLGPRALGEVYDTFAAVTQKFEAEFGTNLYNGAVRNGFPGAVR